MKYWLHGTISFARGVGPTNQYWCQKTRVITVSCGIKISALHHLVLSQYTHLTDRQTDEQTDRQNCNSNTVCCITCSRTVKNLLTWAVSSVYPVGWMLIASAVMSLISRPGPVSFSRPASMSLRDFLRRAVPTDELAAVSLSQSASPRRNSVPISSVLSAIFSGVLSSSSVPVPDALASSSSSTFVASVSSVTGAGSSSTVHPYNV